MIDTYEINKYTLAIIPLSTNSSRVIEADDIFDVKRSTAEIIDDSCRFFGCTYEGRREGTKELIKVNYKAPIIIEETLSIIFFPTSSPRYDTCYWISLNNMENYVKHSKNKSSIIFKNGKRLDLDISFGSLENQVMRATMLEAVLNRRKRFEK